MDDIEFNYNGSNTIGIVTDRTEMLDGFHYYASCVDTFCQGGGGGLPQIYGRSYWMPKCIKRRGTATIVEWKDGTQTKIVRPAEEEDGGIYTAFCIALGKKLFGNNSALKRAVHKADESVLLKAEQERKEKRTREHNARMRRQLKRAVKRIEKAARRQLNREIIGQQTVERIAAEADEA